MGTMQGENSTEPGSVEVIEFVDDKCLKIGQLFEGYGTNETEFVSLVFRRYVFCTLLLLSLLKGFLSLTGSFKRFWVFLLVMVRHK